MAQVRAALILAAVVAAASAPAAAADPPLPPVVRDLQRAALEDARAYETLRSLTEEVGARFAGSEGDAKAVEWALRTLRAQGFANVRAEPVTVPHWIRGEAACRSCGVGEPARSRCAVARRIGRHGRWRRSRPTLDRCDHSRRAGAPPAKPKLRARSSSSTTACSRPATASTTARPSAIAAHGAIAAAKLGARRPGDPCRRHRGRRPAAHRRHALCQRRPAHSGVRHRQPQRRSSCSRAYARGPVRLRVSSTARCAAHGDECQRRRRGPGPRQPATRRGGVRRARARTSIHGTSARGAQDDGAGVATVLEAARRDCRAAAAPAAQRSGSCFMRTRSSACPGGKRYALEHEPDLVASSQRDRG